MQYKMLATDFDNTLVPFGQQGASRATVAAIARLRGQGVPFVICTGRCHSALRNSKTLLRGLPYDYLISANGAYVTNAADQVLYQSPLTSEDMYVLVDFCEDYDYLLAFAFSDGYYAYTGYEDLRGYYSGLQQVGMVLYDGEDQDRHIAELPTAAFVVMPKAAEARFQEKYGYLDIRMIHLRDSYRDGWAMYDVMHSGVDKAAGLRGLCQALGLPMEQVVAVGDGANDCGMLTQAGLGCAVENAVPAALAAAKRIIAPAQKDGVAALIDALWPAHGSPQK